MEEEKTRIANEILDLSRNRLLVNLRFMDMALSYHKRVEYEGTIATDGKNIFFNPDFLLSTYKETKEKATRLYLHLVFHCIFHHPFVGASIDQRLWNLACDMAVECAIDELGLTGISSGEEKKHSQIMSELKKELNILSAEKIYTVLKNGDYAEWMLQQWEEVFHMDDHTLWYSWLIEAAPEQSLVTNPGFSAKKTFWEQVSQQIQMDLDTFSKQHGENAGNLIQNLRSVNREKYDYSEFLRKFAVYGEAMKVNDDEFDYIYYTYGLEHYDNMPLIEPLEYKEVKRIREFVIAIDTSGSVSGDEVQLFLQKTYNILMEKDSYFSRVNIHIIQCDAEIQEDHVIHNQEEFTEYLNKMEIRGLGGTDFRPVFNYVNHLIAEKTFLNLKGMIYLTDGYGTFPEKKPEYDAAFVFVKDEYEIPEVPPWAIKLVLQHEDIV